jgi:NAD+ kinase
MRIAVVRNPKKPEIEPYLRTLASELQEEGHLVVDLASIEDDSSSLEEIVDANLLLVLGGDGTTLKAVSLLTQLIERGEELIPLVTVDFGSRGFLSSCAPENARRIIDGAARGQATSIPRRLGKALFPSGRTYYFLNEVSFLRFPDSTPLHVRVRVPGRELNVKSDGIIVSTETGSSAYARSAGGPVLCGVANALVIAWVAPIAYVPPLVSGCAEDDVVIVFEEGRGQAAVDGAALPEGAAGEVHVALSEHDVIFLVDEEHYLTKLHIEGVRGCD